MNYHYISYSLPSILVELLSDIVAFISGVTLAILLVYF